MSRYEMIIFWSDEDDAFVADVPELSGCMAHGETYEDAVRNAQSAIDLWIDTAKEFHDPIPEPKGRRLVSHKFPAYTPVVSTDSVFGIKNVAGLGSIKNV